MIFVDWLSIYQDFPGTDYPRLASEIRTSYCALTGELLKESAIGYKHAGSFDTNVLIKFDGQRLSMSGNPSAWNRPDNLFGVRSVRAAVDVFNSILKSLGYPEFFDCENTNLRAMPYQSNSSYYRPGLKLTRVDLTENYSSDCPIVELLRYLSTFNYRGQTGYLYPNGRTVDWMGDRSGEVGASKRLYFKYYDKAYDIDLKIKKLQALRNRIIAKDEQNANTLLIDERINYLSKLLYFLIENNVSRFELELKSKMLDELGLSSLVGWSDEKMTEIFNKYKLHEKQKVQFSADLNIYDKLISLDVKPPLARTASNAAQMWLDGHDIHFERSNVMSRATFYRVRKVLLLLGFDILSPLNVINFPKKVYTVTLKPLDVPSWYKVA